MDGPDFYALFQQQKLIPEYHTVEIIAWLRFFKGQAMYQAYLDHYLPLLSEADRAQFLDDVTDESVKASLVKKEEVVPEVAPSEVVKEEEPKTEEKPKKKKAKADLPPTE